MQVRRALVEYGLQHKTNAEIDAAMANVDQEQIRDLEKAKLTVEVWDKVTPINGVEAAQVIASHNIPSNGTAYMIKEGDRILYFQARDPQTGGVITAENAMAIGTAHRDQLAEARAVPQILEAIIDQLDV